MGGKFPNAKEANFYRPDPESSQSAVKNWPGKVIFSGWEIGNNLQGRFIYHSGSLGGFRTYMEQQLGSENAMIILSNNSSSSILDIRNTRVKIIDGRPYSTPDSN